MEGVGRCEEELVASLGGDKAGELREPGRGEGGYEVKAVIRTDFYKFMLFGTGLLPLHSLLTSETWYLFAGLLAHPACLLCCPGLGMDTCTTRVVLVSKEPLCVMIKCLCLIKEGLQGWSI